MTHPSRRFASKPARAGCVVIVDRTFDRPDRDRATRWVDSMFALPSDEPVPGAISALAKRSDWRAVESAPGLARTKIRRYRTYRLLSPQAG
ncbi:MAG: hypothetical protein J2P19_32325 [Pseudonocardia sp.]|nr:hypothetical protein [Pseudonocardia sp.]